MIEREEPPIFHDDVRDLINDIIDRQFKMEHIYENISANSYNIVQNLVPRLEDQISFEQAKKCREFKEFKSQSQSNTLEKIVQQASGRDAEIDGQQISQEEKIDKLHAVQRHSGKGDIGLSYRNSPVFSALGMLLKEEIISESNKRQDRIFFSNPIPLVYQTLIKHGLQTNGTYTKSIVVLPHSSERRKTPSVDFVAMLVEAICLAGSMTDYFGAVPYSDFFYAISLLTTWYRLNTGGCDNSIDSIIETSYETTINRYLEPALEEYFKKFMKAKDEDAYGNLVFSPPDNLALNPNGTQLSSEILLGRENAEIYFSPIPKRGLEDDGELLFTPDPKKSGMVRYHPSYHKNTGIVREVMSSVLKCCGTDVHKLLRIKNDIYFNIYFFGNIQRLTALGLGILVTVYCCLVDEGDFKEFVVPYLQRMESPETMTTAALFPGVWLSLLWTTCAPAKRQNFKDLDLATENYLLRQIEFSNGNLQKSISALADLMNSLRRVKKVRSGCSVKKVNQEKYDLKKHQNIVIQLCETKINQLFRSHRYTRDGIFTELTDRVYTDFLGEILCDKNLAFRFMTEGFISYKSTGYIDNSQMGILSERPNFR